MADHADDDRQEGAEEGPDDELFAALETVLLTGIETEDSHRDRQQPQPLPHQRGRHEQLLHLQDEDVQPVQHLGGQLQHHKEDQEVVDEDGPLQSTLVLGSEN